MAAHGQIGRCWSISGWTGFQEGWRWELGCFEVACPRVSWAAWLAVGIEVGKLGGKGQGGEAVVMMGLRGRREE